MNLTEAQKIAEITKSELAPHCERIEIAGSIRRKKPEVKDIEIVCIAKAVRYWFVFFRDRWEKVKGDLPCKYTQRILPQGIKLDLFLAEPANWGLIFAIRTGSADYSHKILATGWVKNGYQSRDGYLTHQGIKVSVPEEEDLFEKAGVKFIPPEKREL